MLRNESALRRSLRSISSTNQSTSVPVSEAPSSSSSAQNSASSSKKRKSQPDVATTGKKTPKAPKQEAAQQLQPGSGDSKYSVMNLNTSFKEFSARRRSPAMNFKLNILKPLNEYRPELPRYKRTPVQNPALCADVAENILDMCFEQEDRYSVRWNYMAHQPTLNWRMREILIDWIVDVHMMMKLAPPTLWLTVNLIDRTLAKCTVKRDRLQLVGIGALSLACKLEEIAVPYPDDFTYITEDAYNLQDLLDMELTIWKAANYELVVPTGYNFLVHYLDTLHASDVTRQLALYYAERNLQETTMLAAKPSVYAAACVYAAVAQRIQQGEPVCSDTPSDEREPPLGSMENLMTFLAQSAAAAAAEASANAAAEGTAEDAGIAVPEQSEHDVEGSVNAAADGVPAAVEITAHQPAATAPAEVPAAEPETLTLSPHDADQQWMVDTDSPSRESRDRCIPTEATLWGLELTRRAPVRVLQTTEGAAEPPAAPSDRVPTFSPLAASSGAAHIAGVTATTPHFPATSSSAPAQQCVYEADVTEDVISRGAERVAQEIPPKDARALPHLAKAIIAITGGTTVCALHRQLNAARRKYATVQRLCVSDLPLPFEEALKPTVPTDLHGPVFIKAGKGYFRHRETSIMIPPTPHHFPLPSAVSADQIAPAPIITTTAAAAGTSSSSSSSNSGGDGAPGGNVAADPVVGGTDTSNAVASGSSASNKKKRSRAPGSSRSRKTGTKRARRAPH